MPAQIEVRGLRCQGRHGVYAEEQAADRPFLVDLALDLADIGAAARSDDLADALDFAELVEAVRGMMSGPPRKLLEALVVDVAREVLRRFPSVVAATVRVVKSEPPGLDAAAEAVTITLRREG